MPQIELGPDNVEKNREIINAAISAYQGAIKMLQGLHHANQGACPHKRQVDRHDPGYAGGGYSHTECLICGAHI